MRQRKRRRVVRIRHIHRRERSGEVFQLTIRQLRGIDGYILMLVAPAELQTPSSLSRFLEDERRSVLRQRRREKLFFAFGEKVAPRVLHADRSRQRTECMLRSFEAALRVAVEKRDVRGAAGDLGLVVIRVTEAQLVAAEEALAAVKLRAEIPLPVAHVDAHGLIRLVPRPGVGDAVVRVVAAVGEAEIPGLAHERRAGRAARRIDVAVEQFPDGRVVVAGLAPAVVAVPREHAGSAAERQRAVPLVAVRRAAQIDRAAHRLAGARRWNAIVEHVDDAANGIAAVEERRRTAHDLDALRVHGIDGDVVILTDVRRVAGADAVFENADAIAAEAADDRPAGAWNEAGRRYARFLRQRLPERRLLPRLQIRARDDIDRLRRFGRDLGPA